MNCFMMTFFLDRNTNDLLTYVCIPDPTSFIPLLDLKRLFENRFCKKK